MTIAWGACGHPLRVAECMVCFLVTEEPPSTERQRAHREWRGRDAEANAWEPCAGYDDAAACDNLPSSMCCANVHGERDNAERAKWEAEERKLSIEGRPHPRAEVDDTIARICPPTSRNGFDAQTMAMMTMAGEDAGRTLARILGLTD